MLGMALDGDTNWDIPAPDDIENFFDGEFMRLLACPSEDFDVLETAFDDGCPAVSYAPADPPEERSQANKPLDAAREAENERLLSLEPESPPRKKRTRQPVSSEVASSRLEKTRARNRRAQAKFREKQKARLGSHPFMCIIVSAGVAWEIRSTRSRRSLMTVIEQLSHQRTSSDTRSAYATWARLQPAQS